MRVQTYSKVFKEAEELKYFWRHHIFSNSEIKRSLSQYEFYILTKKVK